MEQTKKSRVTFKEAGDELIIKIVTDSLIDSFDSRSHCCLYRPKSHDSPGADYNKIPSVNTFSYRL